MEPSRQVEIQLGHMCNNRCVFCVSGQRTARRRAPPLAVPPLLDRVERARRDGHAKITLLGGEPTLQPGFFDVLRRAVDLGFEEVVIFTNGVKTSRAWFVDRVLAVGGPLSFRLSFQGATEEAHDRTTGRRGSFRRLVRSLELLHERDQDITVNTCVVRSNQDSLDRFPDLLLPFGVRQLHLDMIRPLDAGDRSDTEMRAMLPRYSELTDTLTRMVRGFPTGFDVNIGNLPYCVAPHLVPYIHHDGEPTETVSVEGDDRLSTPWDKYRVKRRDKTKPESCRRCALAARCSGVFETYLAIHGDAELRPIDAAPLLRIGRRDPPSPTARALAALRGWVPPPPFDSLVTEAVDDRHARLTLGGRAPLRLHLGPPGRPGAAAGFVGLELHVESAPADARLARRGLRALTEHLAAAGHAPTHPAGDDGFAPVAVSVRRRLARLRRAAPFGELRWSDVRVSRGGRRAELCLLGADGERATVWLAQEGRRATGGYRVDSGAVTARLVRGLGELMAAVRD